MYFLPKYLSLRLGSFAYGFEKIQLEAGPTGTSHGPLRLYLALKSDAKTQCVLPGFEPIKHGKPALTRGSMQRFKAHLSNVFLPRISK